MNKLKFNIPFLFNCNVKTADKIPINVSNAATVKAIFHFFPSESSTTISGRMMYCNRYMDSSVELKIWLIE